MTASDLGAKVSMLYRIHGDAEHPFSEVSGVLMRVEPGERGPIYHVVRRSGAVAEVNSADVLKLKVN